MVSRLFRAEWNIQRFAITASFRYFVPNLRQLLHRQNICFYFDDESSRTSSDRVLPTLLIENIIWKNKRVSYTGRIPSLNKDFILIKTQTGHINLKLKDIVSIELVEEVLYESA